MKLQSVGKPLFVLIDQSVQKPGGHHYEYAKRILDAAARQGHETVLLAHKSYRGTVEHRVVPAFSWTFWDNYNFYYVGRRKPSAENAAHVARFKKLQLDLKRRILFSRMGLALGRARHVSLSDVVMRSYLPSDTSFIPTPRWLLATSAIALRVAAILRRFKEPSGPIYRMSRKFARAVLMMAASPAALLGAPFVFLRRQNPGRLFSREMSAAMVKLGARGEQACIFVPNATAAELHGLAELARQKAPAATAHWTFLYRRPIFAGYPGSYASQAEDVRRYRVEFAQLREAFPDLNVDFYTDTDELTEQYNFLRIYPFETLPVPVDPVPHQRSGPTEPLTIGYLGDARDEKGFQHLPGLVEHVKQDCSEREIRFIFQSNYNTPSGEPESRNAKNLLQGMHSERIELVEGPFDSNEYLALLERMDVILIPYAAENYAARSSGVLVEAISGRRPALVPGGSWMAGLVEQFRKAHIDNVLPALTMQAELALPFQQINDKELRIDPTANYVVFLLQYPLSFDGYVRIRLSSLNKFGVQVEFSSNIFKAVGGKITAFFSKRESERLWWKADVLDRAGQMEAVNATIRLYKGASGIPLSAGVVTFDQPKGIISASDDLIRNFDHHRRAMDNIAEILRPYYSPDELVKRLGSLSTLSESD